MSLARKLMMGAGGGIAPGGLPVLVGDLGRNGENADIIIPAYSGTAIDVLSLSPQVGDLVVMSMTFDTNTESGWSWTGVPFTTVVDETDSAAPGRYLGYHFWTGTESNISVSSLSSNSWRGMSLICAVFRNVTAFAAAATEDTNGSGMPTSPPLDATGHKLLIQTCHIDDDEVTDLTEPTGSTLIRREVTNEGSPASSSGLAYRVASDLGSIGAGDWFGSGSDSWAANTISFT